MTVAAMLPDDDPVAAKSRRSDRTAASSLERLRAQRYGSGTETAPDALRVPPPRRDVQTSEPPKGSVSSILDSQKMVQLHARQLDDYRRELDRQTPNRFEMALDNDFYDHIQWDEADAQIVRERGQIPLVFNIIASPVNWVIGTEKRGRSDFKILPRRKEDGKPAERKTELMKYLSDVNRTPFSRSQGFEDSVKVGVGWLEDGWQGEDEGEPIYSRREDWRNMLWDSAATEADLSDARYIFRSKWFDVDIAQALFPSRAALIESCAENPTPYMSFDSLSDEPMDSMESANMEFAQSRGQPWSSRMRVRLIEAWHRQPLRVEVMSGGMFAGEIFDAASVGHVDALNQGHATLAVRLRMRMHVSIFCSGGMLWHSPSPYRHNQFPFTPIWGYRRARDGMPYGLIRGLRDIQADVNKRASKALYILSTNKIIMEDGAVDDIEELREEASRPDAIIVKKRNAELQINVDRDLAQWHVEMMQSNILLAEKAAGVNNDNLGLQTNAKSGIAIQRRQEQGAMVTTIFFDNLRFASQVQGEKQLSLVEQFMSAKKQFRITNQRGNPAFVDINDGLPENDVVRSKADFVISEADWRNSMREAAAAELMEIVSKFPPEIAIQMLDLVVDELDVKNREELVKRIRGLNGQRDPDADPNQLSPDEQAHAAAAQEKQQMQQAAANAELRKMLSESMLNEAKAKETLARLVAANVGAQASAIGAATAALVSPAAVPVADFMLDQAGFESKSDQEAKARDIASAVSGMQPPAGAAPAQQPPPTQQQPQSAPQAALGIQQGPPQ